MTEKTFWWKGKKITGKQFSEAIKNCKTEDLLRCQKCLKTFKKVNKYTYKPQCCHYPSHILLGIVGK
jgi:hypothetical protein